MEANARTGSVGSSAVGSREAEQQCETGAALQETLLVELCGWALPSTFHGGGCTWKPDEVLSIGERIDHRASFVDVDLLAVKALNGPRRMWFDWAALTEVQRMWSATPPVPGTWSVHEMEQAPAQRMRFELAAASAPGPPLPEKEWISECIRFKMQHHASLGADFVGNHPGNSEAPRVVCLFGMAGSSLGVTSSRKDEAAAPEHRDDGKCCGLDETRRGRGYFKSWADGRADAIASAAARDAPVHSLFGR